MRDEAFRELERSWRETRDPELEQAYVQAAVRRGLPRPQLLLAGYLGSGPALALLGDQGFPDEPALSAWLTGLGAGRLARSKELARASGIRAALASLALLRAEGLSSPELDEAGQVVARWLSEPSEDHQGAVRDLRQAAAPLPNLARAVLARRVGDSARAAAKVTDHVVRALRTRYRKNQQRVREAIYAELLPWALAPEP